MDDVTLRNGEFPRRLAGGRRLALLCFRLLPQRCDERLILVNQSIFKLTENLKSYLAARFLLRVLHAIRVHVVGALLSGTALANAAGVSANTPGHKMQVKGSVKGSPGASGYAPGHRMQAKGSVKGTTGASGYTPGHTATTGSRSVK